MSLTPIFETIADSVGIEDPKTIDETQHYYKMMRSKKHSESIDKLIALSFDPAFNDPQKKGFINLLQSQYYEYRWNKNKGQSYCTQSRRFFSESRHPFGVLLSDVQEASLNIPSFQPGAINHSLDKIHKIKENRNYKTGKDLSRIQRKIVSFLLNVCSESINYNFIKVNSDKIYRNKLSRSKDSILNYSNLFIKEDIDNALIRFYFNTAVILFQNHYYDLAINLFDEANSLSLTEGREDLVTSAAIDYYYGRIMFRHYDFIKAEQFFIKANNSFAELNNTYGEVLCNLQLARIYYSIYKYNESESYFLFSSFLCKRFSDEYRDDFAALNVDCNLGLGINSLFNNNFNKAELIFKKCENDYKTLNMTKGLFKSCNYLGLLYAHNKSFDKSYNYFTRYKSHKFSIQMNRILTVVKAVSTRGEGLLNVARGDLPSAINNAKASINVFPNKLLNDSCIKVFVSRAYNDICLYYLQSDRLGEAKKQLERSLTLLNEVKRRGSPDKGFAKIYLTASLVAFHQGEILEGIDFLFKSYEFIARLNNENGFYGLINEISLQINDKNRHIVILTSILDSLYETSQNDVTKILIKYPKKIKERISTDIANLINNLAEVDSVIVPRFRKYEGYVYDLGEKETLIAVYYDNIPEFYSIATNKLTQSGILEGNSKISVCLIRKGTVSTLKLLPTKKEELKIKTDWEITTPSEKFIKVKNSLIIKENI